MENLQTFESRFIYSDRKVCAYTKQRLYRKYFFMCKLCNPNWKCAHRNVCNNFVFPLSGCVARIFFVFVFWSDHVFAFGGLVLHQPRNVCDDETRRWATLGHVCMSYVCREKYKTTYLFTPCALSLFLVFNPQIFSYKSL